MRSLKSLSLEGNRLTRLPDETFQNLHDLRYLNLAFNRLTEINFDAFDYVGSLSFLTLDASHNRIERLASNKTSRFSTNSNIRSIDLSHNQIRDVQPGFFETVSMVVKTLDLSHNLLTTASSSWLGQLRKLKSLDLSLNRLERLEARSLEESRQLLSLNLSYNSLKQLEAGSLHRQDSLQVS